MVVRWTHLYLFSRLAGQTTYDMVSPRRPSRKANKSTADSTDLRGALAEPAPPGRDSIRFPTFCKYQVMSRVVSGMSVADKRNVFQHLRDMTGPNAEPGSCDTYLPRHGITLGEFSMYHL